MKRVAALVLVAGLVAAACAVPDPGETTYPLPSEAISWPLPTQPASSPAPCPISELQPVTLEWDAIHRAFSAGGEKLLWPRGFSSRKLPNGRLEILAPDGTVVARDGDTIELGGTDYEHVCRVGSVEY